MREANENNKEQTPRTVAAIYDRRKQRQSQTAPTERATVCRTRQALSSSPSRARRRSCRYRHSFATPTPSPSGDCSSTNESMGERTTMLALHSVMRLDKSTVSSACCNYDCMNLSLEKWLLAQSHRDDSVGELARKWVSNGKTQTNAREWLVDIGDYSNWRSTVERIDSEYAAAVDCLSRGESAPTFPKLFASEDYERKLQQSCDKHKAQR